MAQFKIPGGPIALQRARAGKHGFYDPQKHIKTDMQIYLSHYDGPILEGPLFLTIFFFMPIPKGTSQKKITQLKGTFHPIRPDLDNLIKWINDTCQLSGNIFKDDASISGILAIKIWEKHQNARTQFIFTKLKNRKIKQIPFDITALIDSLCE